MTSVILFPILAVAAHAPAPGYVNSPTVAPDASPPVVRSPTVALPTVVSTTGSVSLPRGPQRRGTTQSLVSPLDYPFNGNGAQGLVAFTLTIDPQGRVSGCVISRSSGSGVLDKATCDLIRRRARYTPAMDSNGSPTVGTIDEEIVWKLPRPR